MSYQPQEGVDYIIDLYAVTGVAHDAAEEDIHRALNERILEYHPDRLEGLAPEFQERGERMAKILNRARGILLDDEKRGAYDHILAQWSGPFSTDGTPVMTMDAYVRAEMGRRDPAAVEGVFAEQRQQLEAISGYAPSRLIFLERLIAEAGANTPADLRDEYETALLELDRVLSIQEAERGKLLGLDVPGRRYRVGLEYGAQVAGEIEAARTATREALRLLAIGSFGTRLAILAGETPAPASGDMLPVGPSSFELPAYFEPQAAAVRELAAQREALLHKRLGNFAPTYPEPELQAEAKEAFIVGVLAATNVWIGARFDAEANNVDQIELDDDTTALLEAGNFAAVIGRGYNVFTFEPLEQIEVMTLVTEAMQKHVDRFGLHGSR